MDKPEEVVPEIVAIKGLDPKSLEKPTSLDNLIMNEFNKRSRSFMQPTLTVLSAFSIIIGLYDTCLNHNFLLSVAFATLNTSSMIIVLKIFFTRRSRLVNWLAARSLAISNGAIGKYAIPIMNTDSILCLTRDCGAKYGPSGPMTQIGSARTEDPQLTSGRDPELPQTAQENT